MHRNARLTHWGRQELVRRIQSGTPIAHAATEMNVSRPTATKWWNRYLEDPDGQWWLDRSSRPHRCPHQTPRRVERRILSLRRNRKLGPARIAGQVGLPASTVHRVLVRHDVNRLAWMDRPTGQVIRRYEHDRPGDLVHVDIKKIGRLRPGGGWRAHGRDSAQHRAARNAPRVGYEFIHTAIDDHSRVSRWPRSSRVVVSCPNGSGSSSAAATSILVASRPSWHRARDPTAAVVALVTDNRSAASFGGSAMSTT